jgi:hypothetical protein
MNNVFLHLRGPWYKYCLHDTNVKIKQNKDIEKVLSEAGRNQIILHSVGNKLHNLKIKVSRLWILNYRTQWLNEINPSLFQF